jgi:predicted amidohydrolase
MAKLKATLNEKKPIRIALLHFAPCYDNIQSNVALLETLFLKAVELQPDLILTPELAVSGYEFYKILGREWIKEDGKKVIEKFSHLARKNKVALVLGSPIYDAKSDKYYNAAIFINEQGQVIGEHHKILVLPGAEAWSSPGVEIKPVEWRGHKIGLLICADAYKESIAEKLAQQGAEVLISLAAWAPGEHGPSGEWEQRSKDTGLCVLVCNRTGKGALVNFDGSSSVVVAGGRKVVEYAEKQPAILTIDVDADHWLPSSKKFTVLKAR